MESFNDDPYEPFSVYCETDPFSISPIKENIDAFLDSVKRKNGSPSTLSFVRNFISTFKAQPITNADLTRACLNVERVNDRLYACYCYIISQAASLLHTYFPEGSPPPPATLLGKIPWEINDKLLQQSRSKLPPTPQRPLPREIVLLRLRGLFAAMDGMYHVLDEVQYRYEAFSKLEFTPLRFSTAYTAARCDEELKIIVGAVRKWLSSDFIDQYERIFEEVQWLMEPDAQTIEVGNGDKKDNNLRRRRGYKSAS